MLGKLLLVFSSMFVFSYASPQGNFCGNIWGNPLTISLSQATANVSAEIFGKKASCNNEHYNFTNDHLYFPKPESDCLNKNLKKWSACPCPPDIIYDSKSLVIVGTPIGNVTLAAC